MISSHALSIHVGVLESGLSYAGEKTMRASEKIKCFREGSPQKRLIGRYMEKFGDGEIILHRIPARINLLGTHIEHRGGYVNYLAIDRESFCAAGRREDRKIKMCNTDENEYPDSEFEIDREMPAGGGDWMKFIRSAGMTPGESVNYVKASVLYLQNSFPESKISGMNFAFFGQIPVGAGLSSSSALVVAAMVSACELNGIRIEKDRLSQMCGEAEWYVGTRGGSGDHAAMILGRKNHIAHMRFFPFSVEYLSFPENYRVICCNSFVEAKKSSIAKSAFNERIAGYEIGMRIVWKNFPELAPRIKYLRDINPDILGSEEKIYEILLSVPEKASRKEIAKLLPEENLDHIFETHAEPPGGYRLRDVLLYGISECERTRICSAYLRNRDMKMFGGLMYISHDGDRVVKHAGSGEKKPWKLRASDDYLRRLRKQAGSRSRKEREKAMLCKQPGAYGCSTEELDFIVDAVRGAGGVAGAKLTGAGLGGCVLVLVESESTGGVLDLINEKYYGARGLPGSAFVCGSAEGAELI